MTPKFKAVLFDLDGTLIDSRADLTDAVNVALEKTGQTPKSQSHIIPHVGNGLNDLLGAVFGPDHQELIPQGIKAFSEYYWEHCTEKTVLYEEVWETLQDLSKHVKMGVVTNKPHGFSAKIIENLQVTPHITTLVGGDSTDQKKPHPKPLLKALESLGVSAENTLFVGDGHQDIEAGRAANVKTCAAVYGYMFHESTYALKPDYRIEKFNELKEIVK